LERGQRRRERPFFLYAVRSKTESWWAIARKKKPLGRFCKKRARKRKKKGRGKGFY